ncbi:major facilitator superfamily protein [Striga asiatica]|uniref:Major facilitator superfamily protein n=1 Tax=Striga asiatica TaxID=4170 RepID=A0A5A7RJ31_STRAF|nr:major facilitator superfamily protein [Striga asiatica]
MAEQNDVVSKKPPKRNMYALMISIMASMTSILLGYDTGVMSGATLYIKRDLKVSDEQIEILVGTINIYSLLGSAMAGKTSDWMGRRFTIVVASVVFFAGAAIMGFSTSYGVLMAGRFVAGLGVGYALMIAPVYAAEVAPASSRGFLTSFPEVFINFGVLLGYLSNYAFAKLPLKLGWRMMLGIGAIPPIFIGLAVFIMPESPRWLVMQGRLGDAKRVLERTSDSLEEAHLRLEDIKEAAGLPKDMEGEIVQVPKRTGHKGKNVWKQLFVHPTRPVLHITIAALGLQFFQQGSGIDAVVMYSPRIYEKAGITSDDKKLLATIAVGVCKTAFILITTFMVDKIGRRVLLLTSCGGLFLSMATLATGLTCIERFGAEKLGWVVVVCVLMTYSSVAFFSMGMGPIAWVYSSEVFPLQLRAQGCGLGVAINRATSGVILMTFLSLYKAITIGGAFFLFSGIAAVTWVFFFTLLPETRGRSLEDMEALFGTFFRWRTTMKELKEKEEGEKISPA